MAKYDINLDSLDDAIKDIKEGKLVILLDNPSREGEGDFVGPAALMTPDQLNTVMTYARGAFIAILMPEDCADRFGLPPQLDPSRNFESRKTNFRVSCDTRYGRSGCSAAERAQTANILGGRFNPYASSTFAYTSENDLAGVVRQSQFDDLVRPGHVIPIVANTQGLYARQGHTEGSVELMKLAGIDPPVSIDMEILNPNGEMAKSTYIRALADPEGIKVVSIGQICDYLGIREKTN